MRIFHFGTLFFGFVFTLACTKGTTNFSTLDVSAIPRPLFNGQPLLNILNLTATETNLINGQCDPRIHGLMFSASGTSLDFSQTTNFTTGGVTLNCGGDGTFNLTLKTLTDLGFTIALNTSYAIQVRAMTDGGVSNPSTINILYSTASLGPKRIQISSGANLSNTTAGQPRLATSANFRAEIRVGHMVNAYSTPSSPEAMAEKTSPHFKMKAGIAADHN